MLAPGPEARRLGLRRQLGLLGPLEAGALRTVVRLALPATTGSTRSTGPTRTATATGATATTRPTAAVSIAPTGLALPTLGLLRVVPGGWGRCADELDDVGRLLLLGRRHHGDDGDALHVVVGVGLDGVADLHPCGEQGGVEHALGGLGARGTPRERPVPAVTGELDIDPSGHTANHRIVGPWTRPSWKSPPAPVLSTT